jgi:hypothetical protein
VPPLAAVDVARADFTQVLALIPLLAHEQESDAESSYENESDGGDPESYTLGYNFAHPAAGTGKLLYHATALFAPW